MDTKFESVSSSRNGPDVRRVFSFMCADVCLLKMFLEYYMSDVSFLSVIMNIPMYKVQCTMYIFTRVVCLKFGQSVLTLDINLWNKSLIFGTKKIILHKLWIDCQFWNRFSFRMVILFFPLPTASENSLCAFSARFYNFKLRACAELRACHSA